jgi:hypothetical protein
VRVEVTVVAAVAEEVMEEVMEVVRTHPRRRPSQPAGSPRPLHPHTHRMNVSARFQPHEYRHCAGSPIRAGHLLTPALGARSRR